MAAARFLVAIEALSFAYPGTSFHLEVPKFQVATGEKVAVIGPSGSGKTTLLNLIAGISVPDLGTVAVDGVTVSKLHDTSRRDFRVSRIGFVFQDFELLDYLSIQDNVLHPYRITKVLKLDRPVRARAQLLAERLGISDKLRRCPGELSHGEKQRAAICRALIHSPKIILADEATGNLDPANKTRILELLFDTVTEHGATLIAVTHDHELLSRFDRVIDFRDFRFLQPS
jgi:putative ABC transport system ATP-binding protein